MEKQKERREKTVKCECGITVSNGSLYQHKKSKRHINLLTELNQKTLLDLDIEENNLSGNSGASSGASGGSNGGNT